MCHYFPDFGKHGGHFLPLSHRAVQGWKRRAPPKSRDPLVWSIWSVLILEFLRHEHWSMGVYLLWMVTCYFRQGEPLTILKGDIQIPIRISSPHQVLHYPADRPLRSKTYATNGAVELYCPWCESLPLTAAALAHGTRTERAFNFNHHDFLVVWDKMIEVTKLGNFIRSLVQHMARHSGPSIDAALGTRKRKEIQGSRPVEVRSQRASVRTTGTAPQILPRLPAAYQACALRCENALHKVISASTPIAGLQLPPVLWICSCPSARVALASWCCPMLVAKLVAGFDSVDSLLNGTISISSPRIFAGSVAMLGLAVCSAQCFAHPVPPGQIVVPQKRIQDGHMFGVRNLSRRTFGQAFSSSKVWSSSSATCKNRNSMDFDSFSFVSCLTHVIGLPARTTSSKSEHHFWPVCLWNPVKAPKQIDCWSFLIVKISCPWRNVPMNNIMFALTVVVLTSSYMTVISMNDSLQHVAKFSHIASAPSSAIFSFPEKLETDDSIPFCF